MPIQALSLPSDHLEQLSRGVSALTVDPYKNALYYFFPFIGAFFSGYQELKNDPTYEAMMPTAATTRILQEVKDLTNCAQITREVTPYVALNHQFMSCGGSFSLTRPALYMPDQHLFRRNGMAPFTQEGPNDQLHNRRWVFSDNETRFLIARELGQIKENSALLRIAIKVAVVATVFIIYTSPFGWPLGLSLCIGILGMYIVSERVFQARADQIGVEILARKIATPKAVAIAALEKMRQQNLLRRENSTLAKFYITKSGNNVLDFVHPYLTTRITRLQALRMP